MIALVFIEKTISFLIQKSDAIFFFRKADLLRNGEEERGRSVCWVTPQVAAKARAELMADRWMGTFQINE